MSQRTLHDFTDAIRLFGSQIIEQPITFTCQSASVSMPWEASFTVPCHGMMLEWINADRARVKVVLAIPGKYSVNHPVNCDRRAVNPERSIRSGSGTP